MPPTTPRRMPNLVITIPPVSPTSRKSATCRPTSKPLIRIFPWVVGCTIVLWIFVLRADRPPLRVYSPLPHPPFDGHKPRPFHPPHRPQQESPLKTWAERTNSVRKSFIHAYSGYRHLAAPYDELLPVTGGKVNNLNGWGLSLFDSLDTMWTMGLHDMFKISLGTIARQTFSQPTDEYAPFYDTVLRHLGGLLSAYALSNEPMLLTKADDLGSMLLPAFCSTSGFPTLAVNTISGNTSMERKTSVSWAHILTNQLEFKYLAHLTGRTEYYNKTENVMTKMYNTKSTNGMLPTMWDSEAGTPTNTHYSVGELADSAQQYLLKQWLLTAKSEPRSLELYLKSIDGIIKNLLYITAKRQLLYVTDIQDGVATHRLEHQSCSLPGLLALGVHHLGISLPLHDRELHLWAAQGLAYTCWVTYADQMTGLGPEEVQMDAWRGPEGEEKGRWMDHVDEWEKKGKKGNGPPGTKESEVYESRAEEREYVPLRAWYLLKSELIESFYFLWKTTKNDRWRERGWEIYQAIETQSRTEHGYAGILQVDQTPTLMKDEMPSYFLGETLKYLYLLFSNEDPIPLNSWVFNAKGHPFPVFTWNTWEREEYNITL
ncbi:glycoside hydrolase family 47 protein [Crassisporium funariophilum]|nr:glycoside hydrolase family 47 protein [Crassisporium funariophilum]